MFSKKKDSSTALIEKPAMPVAKRPSAIVTQVVVHYDCGFGNNLFIRGEGGGGLNWDEGVMLHNVKANEWLFETHEPFDGGCFKILINDAHYEQGDNHPIACGNVIIVEPTF